METEEEKNLNTLDPERERQILRTLSIHHFSEIMKENERYKSGFLGSHITCNTCKKSIPPKKHQVLDYMIRARDGNFIIECGNCVEKLNNDTIERILTVRPTKPRFSQRISKIPERFGFSKKN